MGAVALGIATWATHPPVAAAQSTDPRIAAAWAEMANLAAAMTSCALFTTYYVSLETLNDLPTSQSTAPLWDLLNIDGGVYVIPPAVGLIRPPYRVNLLANPEPLPRWTGPYITYQRERVQEEAGFYERGTPLDPWGTPYLFFTPMGLVRADIGWVTFEIYGDFFDRYAIVSAGPNGRWDGGPDGGLPDSDDLVYSFGGGIAGAAISSIRDAPPELLANTSPTSPTQDAPRLARVEVLPGGRIFRARAGDPILIRGYNLGASQGSSRVLFGTTPLPDVRAWGPTQVVVVLPETLGGIAELTIEVGGFPTNALLLDVRPAGAAAWGWERYR